MSWSRFDDRYAQHPKMVALGDFYEVGLALDVAGIGWCSLNTTDGVVPKAQVARLVRCAGMRIGSTKVTADLIATKLVTVGRWLDEGDTFRIHDFLEYNPSKAQVESQRKATADRVQRHRNSRRNGVTEALVTPLKQASTPPPVPVPVPVPVPEEEPLLPSVVTAPAAPRAVKAAKPDDTRTHRVRVYFAQKYAETQGHDYVANYAKDGDHLKRLPEGLAADRLCELVDVFFAHADEYSRTKIGLNVPEFVRKLNALQAAETSSGSPEIDAIHRAADEAERRWAAGEIG